MSADCDHDMLIVKRMLSDGRDQWGNQCQVCGVFIPTKKATIPIADLQSGRMYDEAIRDRYYVSLREQYETTESINQRTAFERQRERDRIWWEKYNEFLKSEKWKAKRARVLSRDCGMCQACLRRQATQVHHLSYGDNYGDVPLFELVSVCDMCHAAIHPDKQIANWSRP